MNSSNSSSLLVDETRRRINALADDETTTADAAAIAAAVAGAASDSDIQSTIDRLDHLSAQIYNFQKSNEQSPASLCQKLYLRDLLYCAIAPYFKNCGLFIVGSTLNGFGTDRSDMDLCLMLTQKEVC